MKSHALVLLAGLSLAACGSDPVYYGSADSTSLDVDETGDSFNPETGPIDGGIDVDDDGGPTDSGGTDVQPTDATPDDTSPVDVGPTDTGPADAAPNAELCSNRVDDDGDRLVDCADPDCADDEACAATPTESRATTGPRACAGAAPCSPPPATTSPSTPKTAPTSSATTAPPPTPSP